MDLFVPDQQLPPLEQAQANACGPEQLATCVELAWHLRQRDSSRALALCAQAGPWLAPEPDQWQGRIWLIRGEIAWLESKLVLAAELAQQALDWAAAQPVTTTDAPSAAENESNEANEAAVVAATTLAAACAAIRIDALVLLGRIAQDQGQPGQCSLFWEQAMGVAEQCGDVARRDMVEANSAYFAVLADRQTALLRWGQRFTPEQVAHLPQALAAPVYDYLSVCASVNNDFGQSISLGIAAYEAARNTGQIRRAISSASNVGDDFNNLHDYPSALEWMQCALTLARPTGWPGSIGLALAQTGATLCHLGRFEAAGAALREALDVMASLSESRNYGVVLAYLGDLASQCGHLEQALDWFEKLEQRAHELGQVDFHMHACCAQARVLCQTGAAARAWDKADTGLRVAQQQADIPAQMDALMILARLSRDHPGSGGAGRASEPDYLQQAYVVSRQYPADLKRADLLDTLAAAHAARNDTRSAFQFKREANAARAAIHSLEAGNRALATQVRHQTESARTEGEYHRQLAQAEAQRAEVLQQTRDTLTHLCAVGQEITGHLEVQAVFAALNRHATNLLDVSGWSIYLSSPDATSLTRVYGVEGGKPLPPATIRQDDPHAHSARCARERREILLDIPGQGVSNLPGTLTSQTAFFAPLQIGERLLGVMAVQSLLRFAYDERALLILRTLCAYGAIALDNARAYSRLQETRTRLVAQEKLAALGALVAGVAHELNTPLGNSLMMASALEEKNRIFEQLVRQQQLRLDDLLEFLMETREAAVLIQRGLCSAAELVDSFKQVALDRTSAQRRSFDLQQSLLETIATLNTPIRQAGHLLELELAPGLTMQSYPGPLGQVLNNLVNNALLHAFDGKIGGIMRLVVQPIGEDWVQIVFHDNGHGIAERDLPHIFDPFFTTRMGQGGSGLGLSICHNIVSSILNGKIAVDSQPGAGTRFVLELPRIVPEVSGVDTSGVDTSDST
jgi:signal transduction histidine kinase/tetratricopeptide (TPR) repeat protein